MATIFTPQNLSPRSETRDMSINQVFTGIVDGVKVTDYQVRIYRVSDNGLVYDSTKLVLSPNLSDGQILSHVVPSGSVTNSASESYKWTLEVFNGVESVMSRQTQFTARTTPVLTFTPPLTITSQSYEFTASITQAEGDIVNTYTFGIYDSLGVLIESSGLITSFNMTHTFEGLENGVTYQIRVNGTTTGNQVFDSGLISFDVSYSPPNISILPSATVDNENGLVNFEWGDVVQIIGNGVGTFGYTTDFIYAGNNALTLDNPSSYVSFDVAIPLDFTLKFKWQPNSPSYNGKIIQLDDGGYEVGYDANTQTFYYDIGGTVNNTPPINLSGKIFYIVLLPTSAQVIATSVFTTWETYSGNIWSDFSGNTWNDLELI